MPIKNTRDNKAAWVNESGEHHRRLLTTSFEVRMLSIIFALICAIILRDLVKVNISPQIIYFFWAWLVTSSVYLFVFKTRRVFRKKVLNNIHFSYYFIGVIYSTFIVHYLGGAEWIAFFVYLFDLIYANALLDRKRGASVTAFVFVCYFGLVLMEYAGFIPHHRVIPLYQSVYNNYRYVLSTSVIIVGMTYFLISYSTGLFFKMHDERERVLIDSKNRFAVKSRQLERSGAFLRRQVEENERLKKTTMDYIKKKELELNSTRKDLEDQIDKMRKTQRSMYFMIEDLNNMSRELKSSRDHLEEKVRERTDELMAISSKLHRSERLAFLGKLAGSITHELKNPLAVLKNAAYIMDGKIKPLDDKARKYMEIMKKEIDIIDGIIEDIMAFARTKVLDLKEEDLKSVVENAINLLDIPAMVELRKDFGKMPPVMVDGKQLSHAIINIANNAIVAMNGNGVLTFRILKNDRYAVIEICDTGPGIPRDQRELIFEPLYSSKPKGTGLGLPIAKMMVESQDGKIDFVTQAGEGTTFRIWLPLREKKAGEHQNGK
jgi:signal transduction histidine kinase